jgi:hypothetical protein
MSDWETEEDWLWDLEDDEDEALPFELAEPFAECFFLSDNDYLPSAVADYSLGFLEPADWEPLLDQLDEVADLDAILALAETILPLVQLPGLPVELLEAPLDMLEHVLRGELPPEPTGRKIGSRRLIKIALCVTQLAQELPDTARAAVHAWAEVHRSLQRRDLEEDEDSWEDMPPAVTGFNMMIGLSLILWPQRAEGEALPPGFDRPEVYQEMLRRWEALPDGGVEEMEEASDAEALFAQGQLAHLLSQLDRPPDQEPSNHDLETARAYSRLSRAMLWLHNKCRHCPERQGMTCRVAVNGPQFPVPLLDVAGEIANTGRVEGCVLQQPGT